MTPPPLRAADVDGASHGLLVAVLMAHGGSMEFAAGELRGDGRDCGVVLDPLPDVDLGIRLSVVALPAGRPQRRGDESHALLVAVLAALGGHIDLTLAHFDLAALGDRDGRWHGVGLERIRTGRIRLHVLPAPAAEAGR